MELFMANLDRDFPSDPLTYTKIYDLFLICSLDQCKQDLDNILEDISQITPIEVADWEEKDVERVESGLMALRDLIRQKSMELTQHCH